MSITEEGLLDLGWRAHVGGRMAKLQLSMLLSGMSLTRQYDKVISFMSMYGAAFSSHHAMMRELSRRGHDPVVIGMETDYGTIERRMTALTGDALRMEELRAIKIERMPDAELPPSIDGMTYNFRDIKRQNKVATGRARAYRGPPPQRHK